MSFRPRAPRASTISLPPLATATATASPPLLSLFLPRPRPPPQLLLPSFLSFSSNKVGPAAARPDRRREQEAVGAMILPLISIGTTVAGGGSPVNGTPGTNRQEAAGEGARSGRPPLDEVPPTNPPTSPCTTASSPLTTGCSSQRTKYIHTLSLSHLWMTSLATPGDKRFLID